MAEKKHHPRGGQVPNGEIIGQRLRNVILMQRKGLQKMYGNTEDELSISLEAPIKRGEEMARKLIMEMECYPELAMDLIVLTLYDMAILIGLCSCKNSFLEACFSYS